MINSYTKTRPCARDRASITVEAALTVPMFVFLMVLFLGLFRVELVELQVNQALSYTASTIAMGRNLALSDSSRATQIFLEELEKQGCQNSFLWEGWRGIEISQSHSDAVFVRLQADYEILLPANLFGKNRVEVTQTAVARRWVGYDVSLTNDSQWVYITPYGVAYHSSMACPYLELSIRAVGKEQAEDLRNQNGGRYRECSSCKKKGDGSQVYITDYGDLYHGSLSCRRLKRTVYRVKKETTAGRSPCGKCWHGGAWDKGSFTVEASMIVPLIIFVIVMALHIGVELQDTNIQEAQKVPAVEALKPVAEMYEKGWEG